MRLFPATYMDKYPSLPSVFIAWFGKRYFVWKGKALKQAVDNMAKEIDRSLRLGPKENDIYAHVIHHIKYARISVMEIEVYCQSEDPVELLLCEHDLLKRAKEDEMCLNTSFEIYLPKWIPEASIAAFQKAIAPRKKKPGKKAAKKAAKKTPSKKTAVKKAIGKKKPKKS